MNSTKVRAGISATTLGISFAALLVSASLAQARLLAQWSFEDYSGNVVHDSTSAFPGTLSTTGAAIVTGGISGNALSLSRAANGYVNMGNVLGLSGSFSIVAWIKMNPGDRTPTSMILSKHVSGFRNGYFLNVNDTGGLTAPDKVFFFQGGASFGAITPEETPISTTSVNDGNWHHIVVVLESGVQKSIYVNGAPAESSKPVQAFIDSSAPFLIGGILEGSPKGYFTGLIDEVQIYNHALTDADVDFLYENPTQVILDCEQILASTQAQLVAANASISALQAHNAQLEMEIEDLVRPIGRLTEHFQTVFNAPQYQIPGASAPEQLENVVTGIQNLNVAQQQALYLQLGGTRKK
jgi:hypothetical protein